jgi:hypothetical protein
VSARFKEILPLVPERARSEMWSDEHPESQAKDVEREDSKNSE